MGCGRSKGEKQKTQSSSKAKKGNTKQSRAGGSYDVKTFVKEALVPAECFACRTSSNQQRKADLQELMKELNRELNMTMGQQAARGNIKKRNKKKHDEAAKIKDKIPFEAVCRVRLTEVTLENEDDLKACFDFNAEACLHVRLHGELLFPPSANWEEDADAEEEERSSRRKAGRKGGAEDPDSTASLSRMRLRIVIEAVLERREAGPGDDDEEDGGAEQQRLQVKCKQMIINDRHEEGGDAVISSWLPQDEIQQDIEMMLDDKLYLAVSGTEAEA